MPTIRTTFIRPPDPTLAPALRLALAFAALKLALHIAATLYAQHLGYSYFRDEFYYILCGRHLAWGYVDHGPLVALQARLAETLFGTSVLGIRLLSHLAGAIVLFLTGLLTWALGGRRSAQTLAMLALVLCPAYLALDSFLSMNSVEPVFWMTSTLALLRILSGSSARKWWIVFGLSSGLGLLNKPSMAFFLAALVLGLLLTPQRRILFTRWTTLALALLVAISAPNLLWQIHHHWPTLEFLHNGRIHGKNVNLPLLAFTNAQIQQLNPVTALLWIPGLLSLLRAKPISNPASRTQIQTTPNNRWLGLTYLLFFALMFALHAKDYYLAPIYPVLFAAGAVAWSRRLPPSSPRQHRLVAFPVYESALLLSGLLLIPMALPVLRPPAWIAYTTALHLHNPATEAAATGPLPQFYADRFGWQQEVDLVDRAFQSLSPNDRAHVTIFANNYGEAGAIDFLGTRQHLGLPPATSGHNNYYLWGPGPNGPNLVIAVLRDTPAELHQKYASVTAIGHLDSPYAMPFEHKTVYLLRGRLPSAPFHWADEKVYF